MTIQALQEFIGRHMVSAGVLPALAALLDERASGAALDPATTARVRELLDAVGAGDLLHEVGVQEATIMRSMIRALYLLDAKIMYPHTRARGWAHPEPELLSAIGETARIHAVAATREIIPACEGLNDRMRGSDAAMLDVGVGVAGTAIAMAQMWPELRITGIDVWQPSLRLARENVDHAGLADRIALREQSVESLDDRDAYDYVYYANAFIPEAVAVAGLVRAKRALRPGGWVSIGSNNEGAPPAMAALMRLRETQWGGPVWSPADAQRVLRDAGYVDVHALPAQPSALVAWVVGRRAP
jgi:SAM-dependent methyltransferase